MKQADLKDTFKKASECPHIQHCNISWQLVSYSINVYSYKNFKKQKKDPDDPEPTHEKDTQMNIPLA